MARWAGNDPTHGFWSWSLPIGRIFGIEVRLHWTLLAMTVFRAGDLFGIGLAWWWFPIAILALPLSVLLHEFGHAIAARAVGGDSRDIILWAYGGIAWCSVPARALAHLLVAAAGPGVSLALWATGLGAVQAGWVAGSAAAVASFVAELNLALLLFNLLPLYPMDGGRIARSILWPLVGRYRAVLWTLGLAWISLAGMAAWAVHVSDFRIFGLALILVYAVVLEHRQIRQGIDPELGDDLRPDGRSTFLDRWRERRAERAAARAERAAAVEQAELDRLLAKVSEHGLPALTAAERRTLQRISERERERSRR